MFFDTNVIILYLADSLEEKILSLLQESILKTDAYISILVLVEVLAYNKYTDLEAKKISEFLCDNFKIIELDKNISELAAKFIRDRRNKTGKKLKLTDAIILSTSIINNKDIITLDKEDFNFYTKKHLNML